MNLTLRQLEVFCAIAQYGNVSRAAAEVSVTQSAASMALAELERQLDSHLFDRPGKRVVLNDLGRRFLPEARELLSRAREISHLFDSESQDLCGELCVGASSTIGNYLMPGLLGDFAAKYPRIKVRLQVENTEKIAAALLNYELDIGYVEGRYAHPELLSSRWREDSLAVVVAPTHPLAGKASVQRADLIREDWLMREKGSGTREIFEAAFLTEKAPINIRFELGHTEAIKQAVKRGLGISCLSRLALQDELEHGTLVELNTPGFDLHRHLLQLVGRKKYATRCLQAFMGFMQL